MTPAESGRYNPFWSYEDVALFVGAFIPCLVITRLIILPIHFRSRGVQAVTAQFLLYVLALAVLYFLIAVRYQRPFWRSLGWKLNFPGAISCITAGPVLAIALSVFGVTLRTPPENTIQNLITDRSSLILVMLFAVLIGPIFEELVFRGFLFPLLARTFGSALGILFTTIPFALLHVSTYGWTWQALLIVGIAGLVFGYARDRTGSTIASTLIHIGYNGFYFAVYLAIHK
jgi:membrane protease YdiL (CAAX protease family)